METQEEVEEKELEEGKEWRSKGRTGVGKFEY